MSAAKVRPEEIGVSGGAVEQDYAVASVGGVHWGECFFQKGNSRS